MRKTLLACLLGTTLITTAQTGYTPAIVIDNKGDSLFGEIDYKNWKRNPADVDFISVNKEKMNLTPASVKSFFIVKTAERYSSVIVDIDMNLRDWKQVMAAHLEKTESEKRNVFLLQIVKNNLLSLYLFTDQNKEHFFYSVENKPPVPLIDRYLYLDTLSGQVQHIASYKSQLETLMGDCPEVASKVKDIDYLEKQLKNIVLKYLHCVDAKTVTEVKADNKMPIKVGIVVGVMSNSYNFEGNLKLAEGDYKNSVTPVFGLALDIGLPRSFNSWHVVNELIYKGYKATNSFDTHAYSYDYTTKTELATSYLQLNTIFRYVIQSNSALRAFVNLGMGNAYMFSLRKNIITTSYSNGDVNSKKALNDIRKYERSWLAGAGASFNRMQLEARYAQGNGFSPFQLPDLITKISSPQLIFTYQF